MARGHAELAYMIQRMRSSGDPRAMQSADKGSAANETNMVRHDTALMLDYISCMTSRAAAIVLSMSSSECAMLVKPASNEDGAR